MEAGANDLELCQLLQVEPSLNGVACARNLLGEVLEGRPRCLPHHGITICASLEEGADRGDGGGTKSTQGLHRAEPDEPVGVLEGRDQRRDRRGCHRTQRAERLGCALSNHPTSVLERLGEGGEGRRLRSSTLTKRVERALLHRPLAVVQRPHQRPGVGEAGWCWPGDPNPHHAQAQDPGEPSTSLYKRHGASQVRARAARTRVTTSLSGTTTDRAPPRFSRGSEPLLTLGVLPSEVPLVALVGGLEVLHARVEVLLE